MRTRFRFHMSLLLILFISMASLFGQGVIPQTTQETSPVAEADSVIIHPFETTEITEAFNQSYSLISSSSNLHISEEVMSDFTTEIDTLFGVISQFMDDTTVVSLKGVSTRELGQITQRADYYIQELGKLQDVFSNKVEELELSADVLESNKNRWQHTLESSADDDLLEERAQRMNKTIHRLDSVRGILHADMRFLLSQQDRLSEKRNELEVLKDRVKDQKVLLGEQLFTLELPGFFRELSNLKDSTLLEKHYLQMKKTIAADTEILKAEYVAPVVVASVMLLVLLIFAIWYKRRFASLISVAKFELSEMHMELIYSPAVTVVFVIAILMRFFVPDLPHSYYALNLLIMMIPVIIIVIRLFGSQVRVWIVVLLFLNALTFLYEISYTPSILLRIVLLGFSITGLWLFIWLMVKKPLYSRYGKSLAYKLFRLLIFVFVILLLIAIVANLVGAFSLAEFFTLLPIQIAVLAIGIQVTIKVADTLIYLFLASNYMQQVNVIRNEFEIIYRKSVRLFSLFLWLFFFTSALRIFRLKDAVFDWGLELFTTGRKIGNAEFSLGNIFILIFVIWLSIMITRIISHILEEDVFTRVKMSKGVPSTIILLLRVVLISAGFFLALAAAGIELTNISIVLGAFSVGIGFGLQNIFNNMVSGLILAFERPIKVGDVVQVGELIGTVNSIGLRSSVVRSYEGAEVIVPNGNLISNEMINWTRSDYIRRMDIRIGVAYGTEPQLVKDILKKIAQDHDKVRRIPMPEVFFIDFGDSSLDFRLLAWVHVDYKLTTESEIRFELNKRLKEAGVEIPFPQTDLHVRSDDTKATDTKAAAKKPAIKKPESKS